MTLLPASPIPTSTGYVKLESITPDTQHIIAKCARVSNPNNQENRLTEQRLIKYLAQHKHWSPFEMASMCIEIRTTRAISAQILRHRSFNFQEMSQRYAAQAEYVIPNFRLQDHTNRQNSLDQLEEQKQAEFQLKAHEVMKKAFELYEEMIAAGIAKESARAVLPLNTVTVLYMSGTIRSWIHYIQVRASPDTQKEHREIAEAARAILLEQIPVLSELF
jgi:thymidylate synthase (FAD)